MSNAARGVVVRGSRAEYWSLALRRRFLGPPKSDGHGERSKCTSRVKFIEKGTVLRRLEVGSSTEGEARPCSAMLEQTGSGISQTVEGRGSRVEGRGSRVEGRMWHVACGMSYVACRLLEATPWPLI